MLHTQDFLDVFAIEDGQKIRELGNTVNYGIDSAGKRIGVSLGYQHRKLMHNFGLRDPIPRETLDYLKNKGINKDKDLINEKKRLSTDLFNKAEEVTKLPRRQAKAFAAILWDIHHLGDLVPEDNSKIKDVRPPERIVKSLKENFRDLLGNKEAAKNICRKLDGAIVEHMRAVGQTLKTGKNDLAETQKTARKIMNILIADDSIKERFHSILNKNSNIHFSRKTILKTDIIIEHRNLNTAPSGLEALLKKDTRVINAKLRKDSSNSGKIVRKGKFRVRRPTARINPTYSGFLRGTSRVSGRAIPYVGLAVVVLDAGVTVWGINGSRTRDAVVDLGTAAVSACGAFASGPIGWGLFVVSIAANGAVHYAYHLYDEKEANKRTQRLFEEYNQISTINKLIRYEEPYMRN
ncbi:MAG: hypothetical protein IKW49_03015 [Opitutales bacterium]|nr:hypothetical protein [Opitutales bacterium]